MQIKKFLTETQCWRGLKPILLIVTGHASFRNDGDYNFLSNGRSSPDYDLDHLARTSLNNILDHSNPEVGRPLIRQRSLRNYEWTPDPGSIGIDIDPGCYGRYFPDNKDKPKTHNHNPDPGYTPPLDMDTNTNTSRMKKLKNFLMIAAFCIPTITISHIAFLLTLLCELLSRFRKYNVFVHIYLLVLPITFTIEIFETLSFWIRSMLYYIQIILFSPSSFTITITADMICHILPLAALFSLKKGLPMSFSLIHIPALFGLSMLYGSYVNLGIDSLPFLRFMLNFVFLLPLVSIYYGVIGTGCPKVDANFVDWYRHYKSGSSRNALLQHVPRKTGTRPGPRLSAPRTLNQPRQTYHATLI